ncbi:pyruvate formate lyase family protein, partial [Candidatus Poribacteria bacterium]
GVYLSLLATSRLTNRYAEQARQVAEQLDDSQASARLLEAAKCCQKIALSPPESFREALQLFSIFHMVLSCIVGGRNVTPGRMDQYLFPFYEGNIGSGAIMRLEAIELLATMMIGLSQLTGSIATDFQSKKRSPNKYSHCYITLGGVDSKGESGINELSFVFLEALPLVKHREPSLSIRYRKDMDQGFWHGAVELMKAGMPVFAYNDEVVISALMKWGVPEHLAWNYAHCGCMNCFIPGNDVPCLRNNHNLPLYILRAINSGRDMLTNEQKGLATPAAEALSNFDDLFDAVRIQTRAALERTGRYYSNVSRSYPLLVWPLFDGHLDAQREYWESKSKYADQHMVGVATAVDSLLAIQHLVYEEKKVALKELISILQRDFSEFETLRRYILNRVPCYGSNNRDAIDMTKRLGDMWVEEIKRVGMELNGITLRPGFHSWLYNIEMGKETPATPDGRLCGESLSSDILPTPGKSRVPTEVLQSIAHLPHDHTCSGGTTLRLDPSHFKGKMGTERLSALIETYFVEGGLQLHFILADTSTLQDALENPDRHRDLLVRVTGFSEYFVRLLPEVQQEIMRRFQYE